METLKFKNELQKSHNVGINANDFKSIEYVVKDRRIKKAVIKKICNENKIDASKISCNDFYNYMEYDNDIDITLLSTIYKGKKYYFKYVSGCFNAYMFCTELNYSFTVNKYSHYLIKDNSNFVTTFAGWQYNNDVQKMIKTLKN